MTKYKEYFLKMLEEQKQIFDEFEKLHALYSSDEDKYQDQYNKEGQKVARNLERRVNTIRLIVSARILKEKVILLKIPIKEQ